MEAGQVSRGRYAAIELSGAKIYREFQDPDALAMYDEMIVSGAWWDYVDPIAVHRVGPLVLSHPETMKKTMRAWSHDTDPWRRRTAIICQVAAKKSTDLDLLYEVIEPSLGEKGFFLRKAIGWALRSYAWIDPAEIARYAVKNKDRMSGLSYREAIKNIDPEIISGV